MSRLQSVSKKQLTGIEKRAKRLPRRRKTLSLSPARDGVQKLVNVLCRDTYIRPHRHPPRKGKDSFELFTVLAGEIGVITFDKSGKIKTTTVLSAEEAFTMEMPENTFHTVMALSHVAYLLEIKQGPFEGKSAKIFHDAFPEESNPDSKKHLANWRQALRKKRRV